MYARSALVQSYLANAIGTTAERRLDVLSLAFDKQRAAILDSSPRVVCRCSGRAGKSRAALLKWLDVAQRKPRSLSVFVAITIDTALRIFWRQAEEMNRQRNLGLVLLKAEHTIVHPNGARIVLLGVNRSDLIDILRGYALALAIFDEAAFWRAGLLKSAIEDAVEIRLFDLGGQVWVISSPGLTKTGYFHEISSGKKSGWSFHHWTFLDNPHLPIEPAEATPEERRAMREAKLVSVRAEHGWPEDHPTYMREWLGLDADDEDARVYPYDASVHDVESMPDGWMSDGWVRVIGCDYGHNNATAYTLLAFQEDRPGIWIPCSEKRFGLLADDAGRWLEEWRSTYHPSAIVGDAGGLGKPYIEHARQRMQIPVEAADKLEKRAHQELLASALRSRPARVHVVSSGCADLASEWTQLQWDPRYQAPDPRYRRTEDPRAENDASDSALYGYMRCWDWMGELEKRLEAERAASIVDRRRNDPDPRDERGLDGDDHLRYMM